MKEAWYVDAVDALSGMAFASYRTESLSSEAFELDGAAWFISAPEFSPEIVTNRAIGISAARGSFQLGLSIDGENELPFPGIDALVEFIRRLYISGGGGDGSSGFGPAPPSSPEGGGPSPEGLGPVDIDTLNPETFHPTEVALFEFVRKFASISGNLESGSTHDSLSMKGDNLPQQLKTSFDKSPLALAAEIISATFIHVAGHSSNPNDYSHSAPRSHFASLLLSLGIDLHAQPNTTNFLQTYVDWGFWRLRGHQQHDPLDILCTLPIPDFVNKGHDRVEEWFSVKDLFFGILGQPLRLIQTPYMAQRISLFLFAAAAISRRSGYFEFWGHDDHSERRIAHQAMLSETFQWLGSQLPKHIFAAEEEAILFEPSKELEEGSD